MINMYSTEASRKISASEKWLLYLETASTLKSLNIYSPRWQGDVMCRPCMRVRKVPSCSVLWLGVFDADGSLSVGKNSGTVRQIRS